MIAEGEIVSERVADLNGPAVNDLLVLCHTIFSDFSDSYLLERLPALTDQDLWIARRGDSWVGFKLAYRRGSGLLYSWLGGVAPRERGCGIASLLMDLQHQSAAARGYRFVETRTRASNNAMITLNLRHGFHVCGYELDRHGMPVVIQRKELSSHSTDASPIP